MGKGRTAAGSAYEDQGFALTLRNVALVGVVIALVGESLTVLYEKVPLDVVGTGIVVAAFFGIAWMAHQQLTRRALASALVVTAAILGWYHARMARDDVTSILSNQGAIFVVIAGAQAVLELTLLEFLVAVTVYVGSLIGFLLLLTPAVLSDFVVSAFYAAATIGMGAVGIVGRARLRQAQRDAKAALLQLNDELESKVRSQVQRLRQGELLRRFLPPELADSVQDGSLTLDHLRRRVTIVCAAPAGFLESLSLLDEDLVTRLVNAYVTAMSRVAADFGGVVERIVGPRMTVIFGATSECEPAESVRLALGMAQALQREANDLLIEWEGLGVSAVRLRLSIGVAHGSAVVGTFGSERRVDYSALGGVMVRAVRLSSEAIPGETRLDEAAALRAGDEFEVVRAEAVEFTPGEPKPCFVAVERRPVSGTGLLGGVGAGEPDPEASEVSPTLGGDFDAASSRRRAEPDLPIGSLFDGRYLLEARLGRGGMAVVYRAVHVALGQPRALKVISASRLSSPEAVEQFRREAEATARIHHPSVVRLHDFGRSLEGHYYLVLDVVDGTTLAAALQLHEQFAVKRALEVGADILEALAAAHARHLVHQDLKPSNVLLTDKGRALVTDFGLVTFAGMQTAEANYGGTPAYMSPEQWKNEPLDGRSDLYAWGVLMFQMLSGRLPLSSPSIHEFRRVACHEEPPPLHQLVPEVPKMLSRLVAACLEKSPDGRPESARMALLHLTRVSSDGLGDRRGEIMAEATVRGTPAVARRPQAENQPDRSVQEMAGAEAERVTQTSSDLGLEDARETGAD